MSSNSQQNSSAGTIAGPSCQPTQGKRRSSKAVRERKKTQTRVKYNCIGQSKIQARTAAVNLVKVGSEMVDLSDAFEFMDWFLEHVAKTQDQPIAESVVLEFRSNLLALDLTGANRIEKVQFVMDVVRSESLLSVCRGIMNPDIEQATDALEEEPLITLSDTEPEGAQNFHVVEFVEPPPLPSDENVEPTYPVDPTGMGFIRTSMEKRFVPVIGYRAACEQQAMSDDDKYSRVSYCVAEWTLDMFRSLFITDDRYYEWKSERRYDRSKILNLRCCHDFGYTNHHYRNLYCRNVDLRIRERSEFRGLLGVTKGIGVITTGDNGCKLHWV